VGRVFTPPRRLEKPPHMRSCRETCILPGNFPRERRIFAISTLFVHSLFTGDGMETKFPVSMNDVPVAGALQKLPEFFPRLISYPAARTN
jgi:hypothetical protein